MNDMILKDLIAFISTATSEGHCTMRMRSLASVSITGTCKWRSTVEGSSPIRRNTPTKSNSSPPLKYDKPSMFTAERTVNSSSSSPDAPIALQRSSGMARKTVDEGAYSCSGRLPSLALSPYTVTALPSVSCLSSSSDVWKSVMRAVVCVSAAPLARLVVRSVTSNCTLQSTSRTGMLSFSMDSIFPRIFSSLYVSSFWRCRAESRSYTSRGFSALLSLSSMSSPSLSSSIGRDPLRPREAPPALTPALPSTWLMACACNMRALRSSAACCFLFSSLRRATSSACTERLIVVPFGSVSENTGGYCR
mmetsp:Transcript_30682/g.51645  ORF Transcript_30682/g.51645 Transcript_30682/m.51645 type:complete len:306 (-) Transcript_30682:1531-2448(-)